MSLVKGVMLDTIEEHLAVLFCIAIQPDRHKHMFEELLKQGRECAKFVMIEMRETYGDFNHDWSPAYHAFGRNEIAALEEKVIAEANRLRDVILDEVIHGNLRAKEESSKTTPVGTSLGFDDGLDKL
ncbi:MAG TPA: hypothetical protein VMS18_18110 [Candidatus Binatia bacterium]|nr:hypothetical protein [Candidatus Binatia bacterium]